MANKTLINCNAPFSEEFRSDLSEHFSDAIVFRLADDWRQAHLPHQDGFTIPYIRTGGDSRPILYVPGFTEGITAKSTFAGALASHGADVILPGQNRKSIVRDANLAKNAAFSQALNYLSVIKQEGLQQSTVDVLPHSYGMYTFEVMTRVAQEFGWTTFEGSDVIALAPGCSSKDENPRELAVRFARHMASEAKADKEFQDRHNEMLKAGTRNFIANVPRGFREVRELASRQVDYRWLMVSSGIGSLTIFGYSDDRLYPHELLESTMVDAIEVGASYATPISYGIDGSVCRDAPHNDEQFNPSRVASAVMDVLAAKR